MEKLNQEEREFIDGVWRKARYLQYQKYEEEIIKENKKKQLIWSLKLGIMLLITAMLPVVSILICFEANTFSLILAGFILLAGGSFYEYIQSTKIQREGFSWKLR